MLNNRKDIAVILILFFLAFFIRSALIAKGPFHLDTFELARNAEKTLNTLNLHYMHAPGYPLTVIIASAFVFLFRLIGIGDPIFSVNFMSVIFGSLDIAIFYLFSKKIIDYAGALIASLILIFLPLHISVSTFGMTHPLSIFFHLWGFYYLFVYFEKYDLNNIMQAAVFLALGAAARLTDAVVVTAAIFLILSLSFKDKKISTRNIVYRMIIFLACYCLVIFLFYLPMLLKNGLSSFKHDASLYYYRHALKYVYISFKFLLEIVTVGGAGILIAGMGYFLLDKKKILFVFLLIWFFSLFLYFGSFSCTDHRYLLLAVMPILIFEGYYISKFKHKPLIFCLVFFLLTCNFLKFYRPIYFRHKFNIHQEFGKFINQNTKPSSYIIAIDDGVLIEYYTNRKILYRAFGTNKKDFDSFFNNVNKLLKQGDEIYITSSNIYAYDPIMYFRRTLLRKYNLKYIGRCKYEYWNRASIGLKLFVLKLFKIEQKT